MGQPCELQVVEAQGAHSSADNVLGLRHAVRGSVAMPTPFQALAGSWSLQVEVVGVQDGTAPTGTMPTGTIVLDWQDCVYEPTLQVKRVQLQTGDFANGFGEVNASWDCGIQLERSNRRGDVQLYEIRVPAHDCADKGLTYEGHLEIWADQEQAPPLRRHPAPPLLTTPVVCLRPPKHPCAHAARPTKLSDSLAVLWEVRLRCVLAADRADASRQALPRRFLIEQWRNTETLLDLPRPARHPSWRTPPARSVLDAQARPVARRASGVDVVAVRDRWPACDR